MESAQGWEKSQNLHIQCLHADISICGKSGWPLQGVGDAELSE